MFAEVVVFLDLSGGGDFNFAYHGFFCDSINSICLQFPSKLYKAWKLVNLKLNSESRKTYLETFIFMLISR